MTTQATPTGTPAPALLTLRDQIDHEYPNRKRGADGIMGDAAHQARVSDHNQGNALDITTDPTNGPDLKALAEALFSDPRCHYVIFDQQIRTRGIQGDAWHAYSGPDPHTGHLHISIWPANRDDASPWKLHADGEPAIPAAADPPPALAQGAVLGTTAPESIAAPEPVPDPPAPPVTVEAFSASAANAFPGAATALGGLALLGLGLTGLAALTWALLRR